MATRPSEMSQELIEQQHGVIARWQLRGLAPDLSAGDSLLRSGRWQWLYRGVYGAYTGKPSRTSILWAAARRCGPHAALSYFTAAELDRIADEQSDAIDVTIPEAVRIRFAAWEFGNGLPRIILHRSPRIGSARHPARTPRGRESKKRSLI